MATRTGKYWTALEEATDTNMNKIPEGWLAYVSTTTAQSGISTETTLSAFSVSVAVNTSRLLRVEAMLHLESTIAGDDALVQIKRDGSRVAGGRLYLPTASEIFAINCFGYDAPAAGTYAYTVTVTVSGSGTIQMSAANTSGPCFFGVQDLGPQS